MSKTKLLDSLKSQKSTLSKGHGRIVQYILDNYNQAAFMTAKQIGETLDISESTVVRFAKKIGFEGYPEFQAALREDIRNVLTIQQKLAYAYIPSNPQDIMEKSFHSDLNAVRKTMERLLPKDMVEFCKKIMKAENIYIIGLRSSRVLADYLSYYLNFFHPHVKNIVFHVGDVFDQLVNVEPKDVAIFISFPRYSSRVLDICEFLKKENIPILAITDSKESPVYSYASTAIFAQYSVDSFIDSHVAPMALINCLVMTLAYENKELAKEKFDRLEEMWKKYSVYF